MNHLRTILAALLFAAAPAAAQTIKTLGYNTTNGNVVAARTNLTFTNSLVDFQKIAIQDFEINSSTISWGGTPKIDAEQNFLQGGNWTVYGALGFNNTTNAAITRTNLGGTTTGNAVFTATNAAAAATAIGLGTTNSVQFGSVAISSDEMVLNGASINSVGFGGHLNFEERRLSQGGTNIFDWGSAPGFVVTPSTSFLTNVTVNGNLTVKSLTTTDPVGWALDAVQTAAATNGVLTLPDAANVLRITNANAISSVTNGRLGAFYYLINQTTNNLTISNANGVTTIGSTPMTLRPNEATTVVATGPTNVSVMNGQDVKAAVSGVSLTTNNTTLEDIPGLSIPLGVGLHKITTQVFFSANAAAGSKMAMTFDGTGTPSGQRQTITTTIAQAVAISSFTSTSSATAAEVTHFRVYTINVTGAGTLKVQGAQNVAGSNSINATGFLKAERF